MTESKRIFTLVIHTHSGKHTYEYELDTTFESWRLSVVNAAARQGYITIDGFPKSPPYYEYDGCTVIFTGPGVWLQFYPYKLMKED